MPHIEYTGSDGRVWPSVTQLTSLLPKEFLWAWYHSQVRKYGYRGWIKCKAQSNRGLRIGTTVHDHIEHLLGQGINPKPIKNSWEIALALHDKVKERIEEITQVEPHLVSNELRLHGTADMVCRLAGDTGLWILDWKTSFEKDLSHPVQLAAYALCWNEMNPDLVIDQGVIVRVDKKSKNLNVKIDEYKGLKDYFPLVKYLRHIYDYVNSKGPWEE